MTKFCTHCGKSIEDADSVTRKGKTYCKDHAGLAPADEPVINALEKILEKSVPKDQFVKVFKKTYRQFGYHSLTTYFEENVPELKRAIGNRPFNGLAHELSYLKVICETALPDYKPAKEEKLILNDALIEDERPRAYKYKPARKRRKGIYSYL